MWIPSWENKLNCIASCFVSFLNYVSSLTRTIGKKQVLMSESAEFVRSSMCGIFLVYVTSFVSFLVDSYGGNLPTMLKILYLLILTPIMSVLTFIILFQIDSILKHGKQSSITPHIVIMFIHAENGRWTSDMSWLYSNLYWANCSHSSLLWHYYCLFLSGSSLHDRMLDGCTRTTWCMWTSMRADLHGAILITQIAYCQLHWTVRKCVNKILSIYQWQFCSSIIYG